MNVFRSIVLAVLVVCVPNAFGADYYVRAGGSDGAAGTSPGNAWASVSHAASRVRAGDTVYVGAGTYEGQVAVSSPGTAGENIRFIADASGARTGDAGAVVLRNATTQPVVRLVGADYVRFDGFSVEGGSEGASIDGSSGVVFEDCIFIGARNRAVHLLNGAGVSIRHGTIRDTVHGIEIANGEAEISDSTITALSGDAVWVQNVGSSAEVRRTRVIDVRRGAMANNGTLTLVNTLIHETSGEGVYTQNSSVLRLIHCTIDTATAEGARFSGTAIVHNNIFSNMGSHCTRLDGGRVTMSHNLMFTRRGDRSNRFNSPNEFEFDPEYVDPAGDDFSLATGSRARDIGIVQASYTSTDLTGRSRPEGAGVDLGAYEGQQTPKVFYVRQDGSDANDGLTPRAAFRTIQHAAHQCTLPGSTIYVGPGTYTETVLLQPGIGEGMVSGTREDPTRVIADTGGAETMTTPGPVILDGRGSATTAVDSTDIAHWSFEGFRIENYRLYAVRTNRGGVSLVDSIVEMPSSYAFYSLNTSDVTLSGCVFNRDVGSRHGVWIRNSTAASEVQILVTGNRFNATEAVRAGSDFRGGFSRAQQSSASYGVVIWNFATQGDSWVEVSNNIITHSYLPVYTYTRDASVTTRVLNNTITNSLYSIYSYSQGGPGFSINNAISEGYYGLLAYGQSPTVRGHLEHALTFDMNRVRRPYISSDLITDDPMFVDPDGGDFSLRRGSSCADAGWADMAPGRDIDGRSRPADGDNDGDPAVDIGAVELVVGPSNVRVVRWREVSPIGEGD